MPAIRRRSVLQAALALLAAGASLLPYRRAHARRPVRLTGGMMGGDMMGGDMGGMMGRGMSDMMGPMRLGMELFNRHSDIRRQVTMLPNGVQAVTESDSPDVAALIQNHVADMYNRIDEDRPFPYPMSRTVPVMFRNVGRYHRQLELTAKGVVITETAEDADMIEVIRAHAEEISGFVEDGMPAMMQDMMR